MDNAITIRSSRMEQTLIGLASMSALLWILLTNTPLFTKLAVGLCLLGLAFRHSGHNYRCRYLKGSVHLTQTGIRVTDNSGSTRADKLFRVKLECVQPWCAHLKIFDSSERTLEKTLWRDSLSRDDWRKLRQYLLELKID